jgi:hypothetical protein
MPEMDSALRASAAPSCLTGTFFSAGFASCADAAEAQSALEAVTARMKRIY